MDNTIFLKLKQVVMANAIKPTRVFAIDHCSHDMAAVNLHV